MTRHSRSRGLTAALATTMTLGLLVAGAPQSPARADEQADIPVLGRVRLTPQKAGVTGEAVLSLHSVNRTAGATVVYYSIALAPGSTTRYAGKASAADYVSRVGNGQYTVPTQVAGANDGAVIDGQGRKIYLPLVAGNSCVSCSGQTGAYGSLFNLTPGLATVGWFTVPQLPAATRTVDVSVANHIFSDVPVRNSAMAPAAQVPKFEPLYLGQGWPAVDTGAVKAVKPASFIKDLVANSGTQDDSQRERRADRQTNLDLNSEVLFDKDSDVVKPAGRAQIAAAGKKISAMSPSGAVKVTGYTDNLGSAAHGLELSKRRAAAVTKILQPQLPAGTQVVSDGRGEADPIASNDTESGRKLNRRVTITVQES